MEAPPCTLCCLAPLEALYLCLHNLVPPVNCPAPAGRRGPRPKRHFAYIFGPNMPSRGALRALVAALVMGLTAAQFLNQPDDSGSDGGSGGGSATACAQLCGSAGGWRSTALAQSPTANADFKPETADYWRGPVVRAAWPALIGLAAAAALLLLFLLW